MQNETSKRLEEIAQYMQEREIQSQGESQGEWKADCQYPYVCLEECYCYQNGMRRENG